MTKLSLIGMRVPALGGIASMLLVAGLPVAAQQQSTSNLVGDTGRGRTLFTTGYKCYACHGFDAQTGERRLVPMNYTQQGFITFVQNSPLPQMPAYPDMPAQSLADVYAYIRSIPTDAPDVGEIPLLSNILERRREALSGE
jgi:mono/diheme cytochrome c family protein